MARLLSSSDATRCNMSGHYYSPLDTLDILSLERVSAEDVKDLNERLTTAQRRDRATGDTE